jgi:diguanylate cyclase (GGDEF)-like protein
MESPAMDFWMLGLPSTVALAAVAVIGYLFRQRSPQVPSDQAELRRELKRARSIIRDLENVAQQVRRDLARHQGSLGKFRSRLKDLVEAGDASEPIDALASETDKLLEPTQHLTERLTQAYELIRRQANQLMSFREVRTDTLTGLGNRKSLEETLASQIDMHQRYGLVCSLAMFDIDHFRHLASDQGAERAKQVLAQIGQILDQYARDSDSVFRYGSEEFVVVLPGTGVDGCTAFAERMRATIERLSPVTVSCGLTEIGSGDCVESVLSRADESVYAAKTGGRNQVRSPQALPSTAATGPAQPSADRKTHLTITRRETSVRETLKSVADRLSFK